MTTVIDKANELTTITKMVYDYIVDKTLEDGIPPTQRDIMREMYFSSSSVVYYHFSELVDAGLIEKEYNSRRYRVVGINLRYDENTPVLEGIRSEHV